MDQQVGGELRTRLIYFGHALDSGKRLFIIYRHHESPYGAAMLQHMTQWLSQDRAIQKALAKVEKVNRDKICAS
jgi:hypothetical protein